MSGFPILELPPNHLPSIAAAATGPQPQRPDAHLRSTQSINGYHVQASDGIAGHVCDFMMDTQSWAIRQLVIRTGHRFSGKQVSIPADKVERIGYEESTIFVNLTKEAVERSSAYDLFPAGASV
jgi:sporulation protein YlmC with PRC-barrel domain